MSIDHIGKTVTYISPWWKTTKFSCYIVFVYIRMMEYFRDRMFESFFERMWALIYTHMTVTNACRFASALTLYITTLYSLRHSQRCRIIQAIWPVISTPYKSRYTNWLLVDVVRSYVLTSEACMQYWNALNRAHTFATPHWNRHSVVTGESRCVRVSDSVRQSQCGGTYDRLVFKVCSGSLPKVNQLFSGPQSIPVSQISCKFTRIFLVVLPTNRQANKHMSKHYHRLPMVEAMMTVRLPRWFVITAYGRTPAAPTTTDDAPLT